MAGNPMQSSIICRALAAKYVESRNCYKYSQTITRYQTANHPGRIRFHTDNSLEIRYFNHPGSFINRGAFSVTGDLGFEQGDGVSGLSNGPGGPAQYFLSGMIYHRLWMDNDHIGRTFGGEFINNPGRYLVLLPTGDAGPYQPANASASDYHPFTLKSGGPVSRLVTARLH